MFIQLLLNWSTLEPVSLDHLKEKQKYTVLTQVHCSACDSYLKEIMNCAQIQKKDIAVVAAGDDKYLKKIQSQIPKEISLYKTTQKNMTQITRLTPSTLTQNIKIDGYIDCQKLIKRASNDRITIESN